MKPKAIGYIRVSTEKEKQENSWIVQPETIKTYAKIQDVEVIDIITDEESAWKVPFFKRTGGRRIAGMVKAGQVQHIIGAKVDRIFRDTIDGLSSSDWLAKLGVSLHVIDAGGIINVRTAAGRMMFTMLLGVAEFEPHRISERVTDALNNMRLDGRKIGTVPYGFSEQVIGKKKNDKDDVVLIPEPVELAIVREIRERAQRETLREIAQDLNRRGVPTKQGGRWYASTVRYIRDNRIYDSVLKEVRDVPV